MERADAPFDQFGRSSLLICRRAQQLFGREGARIAPFQCFHVTESAVDLLEAQLHEIVSHGELVEAELSYALQG